MFKVDCVGEQCCVPKCSRMSCLRVAIISNHGELVDYADVCYQHAHKAGQSVGMEEASEDRLKVYHDREYKV